MVHKIQNFVETKNFFLIQKTFKFPWKQKKTFSDSKKLKFRWKKKLFFGSKNLKFRWKKKLFFGSKKLKFPFEKKKLFFGSISLKKIKLIF